MNPVCLKLDFLRNRLRMAYFWFLRYVFFFLLSCFQVFIRLFIGYGSLACIEVTQVSQVV